MTDIIKEWLAEILGVPKDVRSESFVHNVQDGTLIAQLLHALCLIDDAQLKTIANAEESQNAFHHVCTWLEELGFIVSPETRSHLAKGKLSAIVRLFYQLYLTLEGKSRPSLVRQTCSDGKLDEIVRKFDESVHIIQWHKSRYADLLERCKKAVDDYQRYTSPAKTTRATFKAEANLHQLPHDYVGSVTNTYDELVEEQNKAKTIQLEAPNPRIPQKIVDEIRKRNRKLKQRTQLQSEMGKMVLDEMFQTVVKEDVRNAESGITKEVLKQSAFEKRATIEQMEGREAKSNNLKVAKAMELDSNRKRDEELMHQIFAEAGDAGKYKYYFKRDKLLNLHREIYAEKLRLKAKRAHDMCSHALEDLVDIALAQAEYLEQHDEEMGPDKKSDLTELFLTEHPILKVIIEPPPEEEPEEIIQLESDIDGENFEAYCNFQWPWELGDLELPDEVQLGANILGHVVFRALLTKYPKPLPPPPPDLPEFNIAVCVDNLTDPNVLEFLDKLLAERKVKIIRMEDAVDFCVKAYEWETTMEYPEAQAEVTEKPAKEKKKGTEKNKDKGKNKKSSSSKGISKVKIQPEVIVPQFQEKQLQTPKIYPCEIVQLTPKAKLGESLKENEPPSDELLTKMFVEYIKSFKDTQGWVLINYPQNFAQAALLEEALTGNSVRVPSTLSSETSSTSKFVNECENCECPYETNDPIEENANAQFRTSKLLTDPNPSPTKNEHKSYLTAYVQLSPSEEVTPRFPDEVNDDLQSFYLNQGNLYTLYYKTYDFPTVKHLAKLIVGDYSLPPKTSVQIFGDTVLQIETEFTTKSTALGNKPKGKGKGKEKSKSSKNKSPKKNGKKIPQGAEVVITREDKETQIPEIKSEMEWICTAEEEPKPGEARWKYVDLEVPDFFEVALATLWENIEEMYVSDFKDLLCNVRMLHQAYVPYVNHVKQYMNEFIARPDDMQMYLRQFQSIFNEFEEDMRSDFEVKSELRCRIYQFREKLWTLCDERLELNEEETKLIAEGDWLTRQTCELTNEYVAQLQLELDRCADTLRLLNEYYVTMMTKIPKAQEGFDKVFLNYIHFRDDEYEYGDYPTYSSFFKQLLLTSETVPSNTSPFHGLLNRNFDVCAASVHSYQNTSVCLLLNTGKCLLPKCAENKMKLDESGKGHFERKLPKFSEPPNDVKVVGLKLLEEWRCAVDGEVARVKLRFDLLKSRAHLDLQDVINHARAAFAKIKSDIAGRYRNEIESVQDMYDVFSKAITKARPLKPELILDGGRFYLKPNVLLFENDTPPLMEPTTKECRYALSIDQLTDLVDVFMKVAPTGEVSIRTFTYVMQDLITQEKLPPPWLQLSARNVCQLSEQFFGKSEVIDWKDFIVYNMCVEFPSEEQLIETRRQLRSCDENSCEFVFTQEYDDVKFWFENDDVRSNQVKSLLRKMYELDEDRVNYTALLLAFCKDENVLVGVAKALELAIGKYVCWEMEVGKAFKDSIRRKKELEKEERIRSELEHLETVEDADGIVDSLIDKVVHECDSCFLEEIKSKLTMADDKKSDVLDEEEEEEKEHDLLEEEKHDLLEEENFSNVEIGFEMDSNPSKVYYLPFEALSAVFGGAMPWCMAAKSAVAMSFREKLEIAYEQHKDPEHNDMVLAHEFLNSWDFLDLLKDTFKFVVKEPSVIIEQLIDTT